MQVSRKAMASWHNILVLLFLLAMPKSHGVEDKVKVSLYYEALCPYCSNFIVNQLGKALFQWNLISIVDLKMVPWGNTQFAPNNDWICQHGPDECVIDIVEACAIDLLPQPGLRFKLIECIEDLNLQGRHAEWKSCMNTLKIYPNPIMDCYQSRKGVDLELQFADETLKLNPPHRFVPWVLVNNHPLQEDYQNFLAYICKAYKGGSKIQACAQHVLDTNSFKEANSSGVCFRSENEQTIPLSYNFQLNT
ncbi:hypothetical protein M8C21_033840 [Ambrosia artemisiifolia]|uniref:Gamma-interferon-inducible lysosomal thiol reductase n=1 Tax=Ambrosia artemisiifolia TaxID=4212 RepID=A0AAD5CYU1_AMBAR|nr:hypothetical protein M8C21_033840 [Ambrosia artemisiifolia]